MSDSLGDARRALRSGEAGEALVHLWNALEQARGEGDTRVLGRIAELAGRAAEQGDEGERAEAERLLAELHGEVEEEEPPQSRRRAALGWLIPIAIFLFFTFRDAFS
jgi:hypothetical protein